MRLINEKEEQTENTNRITQLKELELAEQVFFLKVIKSHNSRRASSMPIWRTMDHYKEV